MAFLVQEMSRPALDPDWLLTSLKLFNVFDSEMDQFKGLGVISYEKL
jgi:hypothetical protein